MLQKFKMALQSFNKRAEILMNNSFVKLVIDEKRVGGINQKFEKKEDGSWESRIERKIYNEEAIESFILHLRFFMQDNEPSSFRALEKFYLDSNIEQKLIDEFKEIRSNLNLFLDFEAGYNLNNEKITNRCILNAVIWGCKAHELHPKSKVDKEFFDKWLNNQNPFFSIIKEQLWNEFNVILIEFLSRIIRTKNLNERVLKIIKENGCYE